MTHPLPVFIAASLIALAVALAQTGPPAPTTPAFPGALGYGAGATGGRGGTIYHVTTLADRGPGSFRDAVHVGKRTVVFDVGGAIDLKSAVQTASDLTIAGQSAPGDGIVIRGYEVSLQGQHNVIVRYVRFRQGLTPRQDKKYTLNINEVHDVIFDHCSIEWGRWDCIGMSRGSNITLQYCLIGESIDPQRFGCLCQSDYVTLARNLWTNNQSRNPKGKGKIQYVNNIVYNWGVTGYAGGHSGADHPADLVGNYFIKGPSSNNRFVAEFTATDHIYQSGNRADLDRDGVLNGRPVVDADIAGATMMPQPQLPLTFPALSADDAYREVTAGAGASLHRDAIDTRLVAEVRSLGKRGTITHDPATLGPVPVVQGGTPPIDTDGDGIPDAWETAHGLDPHHPADAQKIGPDGYTALETYLNSLVAPPRHD